MGFKVLFHVVTLSEFIMIDVLIFVIFRFLPNLQRVSEGLEETKIIYIYIDSSDRSVLRACAR